MSNSAPMTEAEATRLAPAAPPYLRHKKTGVIFSRRRTKTKIIRRRARIVVADVDTHGRFLRIRSVRQGMSGRQWKRFYKKAQRNGQDFRA